MIKGKLGNVPSPQPQTPPSLPTRGAPLQNGWRDHQKLHIAVRNFSKYHFVAFGRTLLGVMVLTNIKEWFHVCFFNTCFQPKWFYRIMLWQVQVEVLAHCTCF